MEAQNTFTEILDYIPHPAFAVEDGVIIKLNRPALQQFIELGTPIRQLLPDHWEEYSQFSGGCMCLTLEVADVVRSVAVTRIDGKDLFFLDQEPSQPELQAFSLAASKLREPLSSAFSSSKQLFSTYGSSEPEARVLMSQINKRLLQMLRIVAHMSDAPKLVQGNLCSRVNQDIRAFMGEMFEKIASLAATAGLTVEYSGPSESIICPMDPHMLERAVLNIISNSMKFTEPGGTIHATMTRHGHKLHLTVTDSGSGIDKRILHDLYTRYRRAPGPEDPRNGLGLGLPLIRAVAAGHGGVVLIDKLDSPGTRITMTIDLRQNREPRLRSDTVRVDYAGEWDHGLLELSETLPTTLYALD